MTLRCALGVRDITPPMPTPLSGFAVREGLVQGTLDPLSVRALLLQEGQTQVAVIAFDLIGVPDELEGLIRVELPEWSGKMVLCATHTHAGPPVLSRALLGQPNAEYLHWLAVQTAELLNDLRSKTLECTLQHSKARVEGVAVNRRHANGPLDPFADVVQLYHGDKLAGLWVKYACHPVALGPDNLKFSADFPGEARRVLEERYGVPVLYTTGCAGQINTGHRAEDSITLTGLGARTPEAMRAFGQRVADGVIPAINTASAGQSGSLLYHDQIVNIQFSESPTSTADILEAAQAVVNNPQAAPGQRAMAQLDLAWAGSSLPTSLDLQVSALQVGSLRAIFLPGEIFVEASLRLQEAVPGLMVVAYAHSNPGYIPDDSAYPEGGYEVDVAYRPYGLKSPFPPGTLTRLQQAARQLLESL